MPLSIKPAINNYMYVRRMDVSDVHVEALKHICCLLGTTTLMGPNARAILHVHNVFIDGTT